MSREIINEVGFLGGSVLIGVIVTFVYDFILIGRRIVRHNLFFVSLEDLIFWAACAVAVFYMLYEENNGVLRWFAVFGAAIGMLLYKKIVGMHFVHVMSTIIKKEIYLIKKTISFAARPIKWVDRKNRLFFTFLIRKIKILIKYAKKKLTVCIKLLKITLCKH